MFGCCQARSELENAHTNVSQLVRSAELRLRDGFEGFAAVFATDPVLELVRALCWGKLPSGSFLLKRYTDI